MRTLALAFLMSLTMPSMARDLTLPDHVLTPGEASGITTAALCAKTFRTRDERFVTEETKVDVFHRYGLTGNNDAACVPDSHGRRCEVDHLVSLEIGGTNSILNLWPQPRGTTPWNATVKDKLENRLHKEVCAAHLSLEDAQTQIKTDWRIPYVHYFGEPPQ